MRSGTRLIAWAMLAVVAVAPGAAPSSGAAERSAPPAAPAGAPSEPSTAAGSIAPYGLSALDVAPPSGVSRLALAPPPEEGPVRQSSISGRRGDTAHARGLGVERARILLQSLTVPGWGQATLGRRTAAKVFLVTEVGIWASFTAFRIQEQLRRLTYQRTAQLFAGIDLRSRDEEFRRIVGQYPSSDEYNRLVVRRDAANLYYEDPDAYWQYIAEHELKGADTWAWYDEQSLRRYGDERKSTTRAALRANTALALAIANRLVSAIHAARYAGQVAPRSWNLECVPVGGDPTAFHFGVRVQF